MMKETAADRKYSREIEEKPKRTVGIDEPFVVLILLLLLIGLVCLYSASYVVGYYSTDPGVTSATYVKKQGLFAKRKAPRLRAEFVLQSLTNSTLARR